jgi:hypothetical protein
MAKTVKTMKPAKTMSDMMGVKKAHPAGCKCPMCKKGKC